MSMDRMSSNNAASNASAPSPGLGLLSAIMKNPLMIVSGVVTAAFFITSFVLAGKFLGSEERWEKIQREVVSKILPLTLVGTLALFVTCALYIRQDPHKTMYLLLVLGCLSIGLAYSAVVISVIAK